MKTTLRIFIISLFLSTTVWAPIRPQSSGESILGSRRNSATNALIKITRRESTTGGVGTGLYVKYKNNYYALTNAHVCVGQIHPLSVKSFTLSFNSTMEQREGEEYFYQEMIVNQKHDVCFIPLKFKPLSSYDFSQAKSYLAVGEYQVPQVHTLTTDYEDHKEYLEHIGEYGFIRELYNIVQQNDNEAITMTYNGANFIDQRFDFVGQFIQNHFNIDVRIAAGSTKKKNHPYSLEFTFPTKPGDSGSPVFDQNYNLIGLVFAQTERKANGSRNGLIVPISQAIQLIKTN